MIRYIIYYFALLFPWAFYGQSTYLKVTGKNEAETKSIDSVGYVGVFKEHSLILQEVNLLSEKLQKAGFIESAIVSNNKLNDSTFIYRYNLGIKIKQIELYTDAKYQFVLDEKSKSTTIAFAEIEIFLNNAVKKMEQTGYPLAKVFLSDFVKNGDIMRAKLNITTEKKRSINEIVFNGYEKFPAGFKKNLNRMYRKKTFTKNTSDQLYRNLNALRFVKQTKYPEVLFTQDSTKIFVYTEKTKANTFDGFVGFGNEDGAKIIFSGYLDVSLLNILNSGEKMMLNWKSNGKSQRNFTLALELPYVFKSPFALKTQLAIFKQDSTFQNTKTAIDLGYYFNYNTRAYLGYQATESSDINNINTNALSDFNNSFVTGSFEYIDANNEAVLFPEKSNLLVTIGLGKRSSKFQDDNQLFANVSLRHLFYFNAKNCISIKNQSFYLQSNEYIVNELHRFGGINSIRGFTENSLQATALSALITEYCYILSPSIYAHTIVDYGYFQDKTTQLNGNLLGLGFGFGILTKNGLLNIIYANGSSNNQAIKLSNSVVQISLKARF